MLPFFFSQLLILFQGDLEITVYALHTLILFKKYLLIIYLAASALRCGEWAYFVVVNGLSCPHGMWDLNSPTRD